MTEDKMTVDQAIQEFQDLYDFIIDRGYSSEDADGMVKAKQAIQVLKDSEEAYKDVVADQRFEDK